MRSIYCLGAIRALLEDNSWREVKTIHASSAGCVSAAVLASQLVNETPIGIQETTEKLLNRLAGLRFINKRRLWKVVDVDYLVQVMREVTPVNPQSLVRDQLMFEVALTDAESGWVRYLNIEACSSEVEVDDALRATMAIPVLYPPKARFGGRAYIDGGISDPLPALRAFLHNPRVIVAISSEPVGVLGDGAEGKEAAIVRFAPGISAPVRHLMLSKNPLAGAMDELLTCRSISGVTIVRISPSRADVVGHRLEIDRHKLLELEALGYQDGVQALGELRKAEAEL
jgi:predicted acylesterase/phospholipase RssA